MKEDQGEVCTRARNFSSADTIERRTNALPKWWPVTFEKPSRETQPCQILLYRPRCRAFTSAPVANHGKCPRRLPTTSAISRCCPLDAHVRLTSRRFHGQLATLSERAQSSISLLSAARPRKRRANPAICHGAELLACGEAAVDLQPLGNLKTRSHADP